MAVHDSFIEVIWIQVYIAMCTLISTSANIFNGYTNIMLLCGHQTLRVQVGYASLTCSTKYVCFETLPFENMMKQLHAILIYYS